MRESPLNRQAFLAAAIAALVLSVGTLLLARTSPTPASFDANPSRGLPELFGRAIVVRGHDPGDGRFQPAIIDDQGDRVLVDHSALSVDWTAWLDERVALTGDFVPGAVPLLDGGGPARTFRVGAARVLPPSSITTRSDTAAAQAAVPPGFNLETVVTGLESPVAFAFAPSNRIYIAEKAGRVRVVDQGVLRQEPFIDIANQVNSRNDRGLLGLALHPQFPAQPYMYLLFVYDPPEVYDRAGLPGSDGADGPNGHGGRVSRLVRVTADAARSYAEAVPGSEVVLLGTNSTFANIGDIAVRASDTPSCGLPPYVRDCLPADEDSHSVGGVAFDTGGALLVSTGDGASYTRLQTLTVRTLDANSLSGKLLRIDPLTGAGLPDNPFYDGDAQSNRSKVYNLGLRNPFRFALHPQTGEPFIGDVGWSSWEEVNAGRGANFGWPCYEGGPDGSTPQDGFSLVAECASWMARPGAVAAPYFAYSDRATASSVIIGDFYTGLQYPVEYRGALFFADYNAGYVSVLTSRGPNGAPESRRLITGLLGVTQIGQGPDDMLYLTDIVGGALRRLRFTTPANAPPVALAQLVSMNLDTLAAAFSSAGSRDPDGGPITYRWDFGDGNRSVQADPIHAYARPGVYQVVLTVEDEYGAQSSATIVVSAGRQAPVAAITSPPDGALYTIGDLVQFSGSARDTEDGELTGDRLRWTLNLHHNDHVHFDNMPNVTGSSASFRVDDHGSNTWYELCLTATDSDGATDRRCISLYPRTVTVTIDSDPAGVQIPWAGVSRATPFTATVNVSARFDLVAPRAFNDLRFDRWSDGDTRERTVLTTDSPQTYSAIYRYNARPVAQAIADQSSPAGTAALLQVSARDPDDDPLTFVAYGLPPGLTIDPATGAISGLISANASGTHPVSVVVRDGQLDATVQFVWTVTGAPGSQPPTRPVPGPYRAHLPVIGR